MEIGEQFSGDKQMASPVDIVLELEPGEGVCCGCDATFEDIVE